MQRRLVLIRHAKTEEGSPDIERRLTDRGRRDAEEIGRRLTEQDVVPDLVVVSSAARARETWALAVAALGVTPEVRYDDKVYENTVDDVLDVIRATDDSVTTLAVVGHNPSLGDLAGEDKFPTAAVAVVPVSGGWAEFDPVR